MLTLLLFAGVLFCVNCEVVCPCSNPSWCQPVKLKYKKEISGWSYSGFTSPYRNYNWDLITTIYALGLHPIDPQFVCYAHSKNVRVVLWPDDETIEMVTNDTAQDIWITEKVAIITDQFLDGLNFDVELEVEQGSPDVQKVTNLVKKAVAAVKAANPYGQISFDAPYDPVVGGRNYDYKTISTSLDFLILMDYDMKRSETPGCVATANSPLMDTYYGLMKYEQLGVSPNKVIMGYPWYGYHYPVCMTAPGLDAMCALPESSSGGCDSLRLLTHYGSIIKDLVPRSPKGIQFSEISQTPWLTWQDEFAVHHIVHFDNAESVKRKVLLSKQMGVGGVAVFNFDFLDYTNSSQVAQMFSVLNYFN